MKKYLIPLIVIILFFAAFDCSAQGLVFILDKIDSVEKKSDNSDKALKEEISKLGERISENSNNYPEMSGDSIAVLKEKLASLSTKLEEMKAILVSNREEHQVAYTDMTLQLTRLEDLILSTGKDAVVSEIPQLASLDFDGDIPTKNTPEYESENSFVFPCLQVSGFFDFVTKFDAVAAKNSEFYLGQAELDLSKALSENISAEVAIAYNSDEANFELGAAIVDICIYSNGDEESNSSWNISNCGIITGQFDVPFGVDLYYYPSIERRLISSPLVVTQTHEAWNDFGVQYYVDFNFMNMTAYWVNGFTSMYEVSDTALAVTLGLRVGDEYENTPDNAFGGRLSIIPAPFIELGGSFAAGSNRSNKTEMLLWGIDLQIEIARLAFLGEYITHIKDKSIDEKENRGFYTQLIYDFGKPFAALRYGGMKYEGVDAWQNRLTLGCGYAIIEGVEARAEYQINNKGIEDMLSLQLAAGF